MKLLIPSVPALLCLFVQCSILLSEIVAQNASVAVENTEFSSTINAKNATRQSVAIKEGGNVSVTENEVIISNASKHANDEVSFPPKSEPIRKSVSTSLVQGSASKVDVTQSQELTLECFLPNEDINDTKVLSGGEYLWYKDGAQVNNTMKTYRIPLHLDYFGVYECQKADSKTNPQNFSKKFRKNEGAFYLYPNPDISMTRSVNLKTDFPILMLQCKTKVPQPVSFRWFFQDTILYGVATDLYIILLEPDHKEGHYQCAVVTGASPEFLYSSRKAYSTSKGQRVMYSIGLCCAAFPLAIYVWNGRNWRNAKLC